VPGLALESYMLNWYAVRPLKINDMREEGLLKTKTKPLRKSLTFKLRTSLKEIMKR